MLFYCGEYKTMVPEYDLYSINANDRHTCVRIRFHGDVRRLRCFIFRIAHTTDSI